MFGWEFPPYNSGGLGIACLGLTRSLIKSGADVVFVLPKRFLLEYEHLKFVFADTKQEINKENFQEFLTLFGAYSNLFFEGHFETISKKDRPFSLSSDLYEEVLNYAVLSEKIAREEEYNLIHCHDWLTIKAGLVAKNISGKPLIFHVHATEMDRTGGNPNELIYKIEKEGMQKADKVIAVSEFTKKVIVKEYQINEQKVEVVHNGIDYHQEKNKLGDEELIETLNYLKTHNRQLVTYIGRFTFQKGVDYFLKAAQRVSENNPRAVFLLAGSGDMENRLLELTASLGLTDRVIFTGFLRDEKLKSLYQASDLFIMPSIAEPFGLVALEALTHETPVILSRNSGVSEVLSHSLKVDFWDTEEMAHQILSVLEHETLIDTLKNFGHQEVQGISWEEAAKKIIKLYQSL